MCVWLDVRFRRITGTNRNLWNKGQNHSGIHLIKIKLYFSKKTVKTALNKNRFHLAEHVARKLRVTARSCTLQTLFSFKAFLLSPPSVAGRTHIKQLSEGIEVDFLLAGSSVRWLCCAPSRQQTAPLGPVGRFIQKKPTLL